MTRLVETLAPLMTNPGKIPSLVKSVLNVLSLSGVALTVLGLLHVPVWLLDGGSWTGSISWRKPILFGVSTGVTLMSLGWLSSSLRARSPDRLMARVVAVALVLEVALITIQQWRKTASHFNQTTLFDAAIDNTMFALILVAFIGIGYFTLRSFAPLRLPPDYALAIRAGMLFLVISCCIGFAISTYGYSRVSAGLPPEIVGEKGVTKFPHGVAIHALQILPAVVFGSRILGIGTGKRNLLVWSLIVSFAFQIAFASYQTIFGFGRFEITTFAGAGLSLVSVGVPIFAVFLILLHRTPEGASFQ